MNTNETMSAKKHATAVTKKIVSPPNKYGSKNNNPISNTTNLKKEMTADVMPSFNDVKKSLAYIQ